MAVSFIVSSNSGAGNNAGSARPAGYDATFPSAGTWGPGDVVVPILISYAEGLAPTAPASATIMLSGETAGSSQPSSIWLAAKIAGGTEPATYDWTDVGGYNNAQVFVLRDCDPADPYDTGSANDSDAAVNLTTCTWTGVTPARDGSLALFIHAGWNAPTGAIAGTPAATERIDAQDGVNDSYTAAYGTGDTANRTATMSSDSFVALLAIFQPTGGGGGGGNVPPTSTRLATRSILATSTRLNARPWRRSKGGLWVNNGARL